ncbi:MAG: universal stress protein, partial [Burkholderiales bacterium]
YKSILVHVDRSKACRARIDAAIALALQHEAHLTGLYLIVEPTGANFVRGYLPPEILSAATAQAEERAKSKLAEFSAAAERNQLTFDTRIDRGFDVDLAEIFTLHARYADLAVVGQNDPDEPSPSSGRLPEQVVLACGRPVLLIPYIGAGKTLGQRVVVGWDASREAARAVRDALPILTQASSVNLVSVNPRPADFGHGEVPGADVALYLARHGVKVEVQRIATRDLDVGNALLSHVAGEAADLLVMGGYGHSRLREIMLGGATRTILHDMTVPVLMAH